MANKYLKKAIEVSFSDIYLDPNNPRIAPKDPPGYDDPDEIVTPEIQKSLEDAVRRVYDVKELEATITTEGWNPVDPILVWELPKAKGKYVVIEGNTRTTALRNLRRRLEAEREKLDRAAKGRKATAPEALRNVQEFVAQLQKIKDDTDRILVSPVNATTPDELEAILPHLHSVRHINHAKPWSPYAKNLYILDEYRRLHHREKPGEPFTSLDDTLIKKVAAMVSQSPVTTRRNLQAAAAFNNFRLRFEDQLPTPEDEFTDRDHYFFEIIMQKPFLQEQFGVGRKDLQLDPEKEEVLFKWAFSKSRKDKDDDSNPNILHKAEALTAWDRIKKYDDDHKTSFHTRLDTERPDEAVPMRKIEADYLNHQLQARPLDTLGELLEAVKQLKGEDMIANGSTLTPMLKELTRVCNQYLRMIEAAGGK